MGSCFGVGHSERTTAITLDIVFSFVFDLWQRTLLLNRVYVRLGWKAETFFGLCMNKGRYRHSLHKHLFQPPLLGIEGNFKLPFTSLIINSSMVTLRNLHRACRTWWTYWRRSWLSRKLSPIQSQPNKCSHFENYMSWENTITSSSRSLSERCGPLSVV